MYANQLGRFTSPDNFSNDTHTSDPQSWNLYVYVRNNPYKYVDPTGKYFVGTDGKPVVINLKTGGLTDNASSDLKRYFAAISMSSQATSKFKDAFNSPTAINFRISQEEGVYKDPKNPTDEGPLAGYSQPHDKDGNLLEWSTDESGWDGTPVYDEDGNYKEVTITIYEPTAVELRKEGKLGTPKDNTLTNDQAIILTGSHELTHPTDAESIKEIRKKNKNHDVEARPKEVELKVYDDIKKYQIGNKNR